MNRCILHRAPRIGVYISCWLTALCVQMALHGACRADEVAAPPLPPQYGAPPDVRSGGVLDESYNYHRQQPMPKQPMRSAIEMGGIPQANGWYNYGFPMRSYRYGWFGAERHDPRVIWHQGYYGDSVRTAYRYRY